VNPLIQCRKKLLIAVATLVTSTPLVAGQAVTHEFETRASVPVLQAPFSVAVGDFNHDGKLDVAVASPFHPYIQVLMGNGDGTFQAPVNYAVSSPEFVASADLNHDGKLDLVVGNDPGSLSIFLGNGDGTFQAAVPYNAPCAPVFVAVADFNGDGRPDIMASYADGNCPFFSVLLGNGDGSFREPPINTTPSYMPTGIGIGDFNRDGKLDVAIGELFGTISQVEIFLGKGDGTFSLETRYSVGPEPDSIAVADFRRNGLLDLAVTTLGSETNILLGKGDGTFEPAGEYVSYAGIWVTAGDFNGDGKPDLAVAQIANPPGVSIILGNGDGTFQPTTYYPFGGELRSLGVGDFNGDHKTDLVIPDNLNSVVITALNTGTVSFSPVLPPNYPFQLVDTTSPAQTVTLTNSATSALSISSISVTGPFRAHNTCGKSVAAGAGCTISTVFKPTAMGSVTGTVSIVDSASSKPQVIELTGAGTVVSFSPAKVTFPNQKVGTTSAPQQIQVTNTGTAALSFSNIYTNGAHYKDFSQTNNCSPQIAAGATCTVTVTFTPKKAGIRTAYVGFADTGGGSPQAVNLSGTGD
jgi:hypothetical protein